MAAVVAPPKPSRKKLLRRAGPDGSQRLRRGFQLAFFALNVWIAIEFYLFVRYYETGGKSIWAGRPPGVEGWLPIASLMNLKVLLATGQLPRVHAAGMFLLIAFLAISFLVLAFWINWSNKGGAIASDSTGPAKSATEEKMKNLPQPAKPQDGGIPGLPPNK